MAGRILAALEALEQPREPNPANARQRAVKYTIFEKKKWNRVVRESSQENETASEFGNRDG